MGQINKELRKKIILAFLVSSCFSLTLFLFGPSNIFFGNKLEFSFSYNEIVLYLIVLSFVCILCLTIFLSFLKLSIHRVIVSLILILSFLLWLQGNILSWNYGRFDGREIDWSSKVLCGFIDSGIWVFLIVIAFVKSDFIYSKMIRKISIFLILIQLISTSFAAITSPAQPNYKKYSIDKKEKFTFSSKKNVIILVLDFFQTDLFQEIISENSFYKEIFDGFTYFRNSLGGFPTTYAAVPFILTGKMYDNSIPIQDFIKKAFLAKSSIPKVLQEKDYNIYLHTLRKTFYCGEDLMLNCKYKGERKEIFKSDLASNGKIFKITLFDINAFKIAPHFIKHYVYKSWLLKKPIKRKIQDKGKKKYNNSDLEFVNDMISQYNIINNRNVFKYYHLRGTHPPFDINENLEHVDSKNNRQSYKQSAKGVLKITKMFLDALKKIGAYDNLMIFIVSDHGYPWPKMGVKIPEELQKKYKQQNPLIDIIGSAIPIMLVKPFNSKGEMKISDAPVSQCDIPKTVFSELGLKNDSPGYSMFDIQESEKRQRRFFYYHWGVEYHSFSKEFLPPMKEYIVSGFSWFDESWECTKHTFTSKGVIKAKSYQYGKKISFGKKGNSFQFHAMGWSHPEKDISWTYGKTAKLLLPITQLPKKDLLLKVVFSPFLAKGKLKRQRVDVYINNTLVDRWIATAPGEYKATIPKEYVNDDNLIITFKLPDAASPREMNISKDARVLGIAVKSLILLEEPII